MKDLYYVNFEARFRGSYDQIYTRLGQYDQLLNLHYENVKNKKILDVGCGRGEWLSKCLSFGFDPIGIDENIYMTKQCINKGFKVIKNDIFSGMQDLSEKSFSIISAFHLIEHLNHNEIEKFLIECKRLIEDDGLIIFETPNIDNISVASRTFYLDTTHKTLINPDSLLFQLQEFGFYGEYFMINGNKNLSDNPRTIFNIFDGSAQDLLVIASLSENTKRNLFNGKSEWLSSINHGMSTRQSATFFDEDYDRLKKDFYSLQKHLIVLENKNNRLQNKVLLFEKIFQIQLLYKLHHLIKKIKAKIKRLLFRIAKKIYFNFSKIGIMDLLLSSKYSNILLRLIVKFLRLINLSSLSSKILKSDLLNTQTNSESKSNFSSFNYFDSPTSGEIYKRLSK